MGFRIGQKVGGYEFLRVTDTSGSGVTYEVFNDIAQRPELLKVLPRDLQDDRERVERFIRQAKIHAHLTHPNIAAFYSAMELDGQLVMTMEAVEGKTLEERLAEGPLAPVEAAEIARQALAALAYAHSQNVVHREITPENLYLTPEGRVKLVGFGLAKQAADPQLTQPGMVMGASYYMSPEQVKGTESLDGRSDIYSLGVVLYEMAAGERPFNSKSHFEVIQSHVMTPPRPPSELRSGLPAALEQAILRALAKDPADRFQTAEEFIETLATACSAAVEPQADFSVERADAAEAATPTPDYEAFATQPPSEAAPAPVEAFVQPAAVDPSVSERIAELLPETAARAPDPLEAFEAEREYAPIEASAPTFEEPPLAGAPPSLPQQRAAPPPAGAVRAPEGWQVKDLFIVGALTFMMATALIMAILIMVNR